MCLFLASGFLLGFRFWLSHETTVPAIGGSYIEGAVGTPQFINPLYASSGDIDGDIARLVYSGLMRYDGDHALVPDLAEHVALSEDQKTYTFSLRSNALWHDGAPVTSADILFTIHAIQDPAYHSPLAAAFTGTTVEAPDERTVIFTLTEPLAPFLSALTVGILPAHLWEEVAPQYAPIAQLNSKPVGSGPFMFSKLVKDTNGLLRSYTLGRNPAFYRGTVYLNEITFKFYSSLHDLADAVRNKNVEGASVLAAQSVQPFANDGSIAIFHPNLQQYTGVFFHQKRSPVLADDDVRRALILSTDRTTITQKAVGTYGTPILSPILPGMPGYDASITVPAGDIDAAKTLLDAKGWVLADGATVRTKAGASLAFSLTVLNTPDLLAAATALQHTWEMIGAAVTIEAVDPAVFQSDVLQNHTYDALLAGERYGAYPDIYPFWHSSQISSPGLNLSGFTNRKVDTAIETARTTTDHAKAAEAAQLLFAAFVEEQPALMLYQPQYLYALSPKIFGANVSTITTPSDRFTSVEQWYRKTKHTF